jgi:glycosyltransferase involved in cell wall biosynthesis
VLNYGFKYLLINDNTMKLAILQRVCTSYRVPLFQRLSNDKDIDFRLYIGVDVPESKVKNASDLSGINLINLKSYFIKLKGHYFPIPTNLIMNLCKFKPDVIICEGESHFFGYLQAILYKLIFNRKVKLLHWCFIELPGEDLNQKKIVGYIKYLFRMFFDAFLVYSSYSKKRLLDIGGVEEDRIFVATNVGDTETFINKSKLNLMNVSEARKSINIKDRFTVLYVGTLDKNKKPELIIELAKRAEMQFINFVILGTGELYDKLLLENTSIFNNIYVRGRVQEELSMYYKAASCLVIPGRGGIVISEAMSFGVPVIVHQADGTEYDLVTKNTGFIVKNGRVDDFLNSIVTLSINSELRNQFAINSISLIENKYNTNNMLNNIKSSINFVMDNKKML